MPLVPLSTIEEWYYTDSWVYRSFLYAYQNQLWSGSPPRGRSVCVYFWSAVLSFFVLRPLIGIALLLQWLIGEKLCALFAPADAWVCGVLGKMGIIARGDKVPGASIIVPVLLGCVGFVAYGVLYLLVITVQALAEVGAAHGESAQWLGAIPQVALPLILAAVLLKCAHYAMVNDDQDDRCAVEWYSRVTTVVSLLLVGWLRHSEFGDILRKVGGCLSYILGDIWYGLTVAVLWPVHRVEAIWRWFFSGLGDSHVLLYLGGFVAIFVVFSVISYQLTSPSSKPPDKIERTINEWLDKLIDVLCNDIAARYYNYGLTKGYDGIPNPSRWRRFANLNLVGKLMTYLLAHRENPIEHPDFAKLVEEVRAEWEKEEARRAAARQRRREACKRFTMMIDTAFSPITSSIAWCWTQVSALWATLISIAKAKKSGACPYIEFKERR